MLDQKLIADLGTGFRHVVSTSGYAINMRHAIIGPDGAEITRGPEWSVRLRADRIKSLLEN